MLSIVSVLRVRTILCVTTHATHPGNSDTLQVGQICDGNYFPGLTSDQLRNTIIHRANDTPREGHAERKRRPTLTSLTASPRHRANTCSQRNRCQRRLSLSRRPRRTVPALCVVSASERARHNAGAGERKRKNEACSRSGRVRAGSQPESIAGVSSVVLECLGTALSNLIHSAFQVPELTALRLGAVAPQNGHSKL